MHDAHEALIRAEHALIDRIIAAKKGKKPSPAKLEQAAQRHPLAFLNPQNLPRATRLFIAGGIAGASSKTATAPIEFVRLKKMARPFPHPTAPPVTYTSIRLRSIIYVRIAALEIWLECACRWAAAPHR